MSWILLEKDDGTLIACEEANPDPRSVESFNSVDELVQFCDKRIAELNDEWCKNRMTQTAAKATKEPVKYTLDSSMLEAEYREKENFNFECDRHNSELQKWQDLKDAALVR